MRFDAAGRLSINESRNPAQTNAATRDKPARFLLLLVRHVIEKMVRLAPRTRARMETDPE
jgi:hypothetical protein